MSSLHNLYLAVIGLKWVIAFCILVGAAALAMVRGDARGSR